MELIEAALLWSAVAFAIAPSGEASQDRVPQDPIVIHQLFKQGDSSGAANPWKHEPGFCKDHDAALRKECAEDPGCASDVWYNCAVSQLRCGDSEERVRERVRKLCPITCGVCQLQDSHIAEGSLVALRSVGGRVAEVTRTNSPCVGMQEDLCVEVFISSQFRQVPARDTVLVSTYQERVARFPEDHATIAGAVRAALQLWGPAPLFGFEDDGGADAMLPLSTTANIHWWTGAQMLGEVERLVEVLKSVGATDIVTFGKGFGVSYEIAFWSASLAGLRHTGVADYFELSDVLPTLRGMTRPVMLFAAHTSRLLELAATLPSWIVLVFVLGAARREEWWPKQFRRLEEVLHTRARPPAGSAAEERWQATESNMLHALRPCDAFSAQTWLTAGSPALARFSGRYYYEVVLGEKVINPRLGWSTVDVRLLTSSASADFQYGWMVDGDRNLFIDRGRELHAPWPRTWQSGDVLGLALDIDVGAMQFALNGDWIISVDFSTEQRIAHSGVFPVVSMAGPFTLNIPQMTWRFPPPHSSYGAWATRGYFGRPADSNRTLCPKLGQPACDVCAHGCVLDGACLPPASAASGIAKTKCIDGGGTWCSDEFRFMITRMNATGQPMLINLGVSDPQTLTQFMSKENCAGPRAKIGTFPMFSPDVGTLFGELACGLRRLVVRAPLSRLAAYGGEAARGAVVEFLNPSQLENFYQDYLHALHWGADAAKRWFETWQRLLSHSLHIGGGAASQAQTRWLHESMDAHHTASFVWASSDCGPIGGDGVRRKDGTVWYQTFPFQEYQLADYGPYKQSDNMGRLFVGGMKESLHFDGSDWRTMQTSAGEKPTTPLNTIVEVRPKEMLIRIVDKTGHLMSVNVTGADHVEEQFVRAGLLERSIEQQPWIGQAFINNDGSGQLHVWVRPSRDRVVSGGPTKDFKRMVDQALESAMAYGWERPSVVQLAAEPWEPGPRNKVIQQLARDPFAPPKRVWVVRGTAARDLLPPWPAEISHLRKSQIPSSSSLLRSGCRGVLLNELWTHRVRSAVGHVAPVCRLYPLEDALLCSSAFAQEAHQFADSAEAWVYDALLGCYAHNNTAVCLLRDEVGSLREPYNLQVPYDPDSPLEQRLRRFDEVPWHIWDLQSVAAQQSGTLGRQAPAAEAEDIVRVLRDFAPEETPLTILPDVLPSLGLLHQFGLRVLRRLHVARAIAAQHPQWISRPMSSGLFEEVMAFVYEWFPARRRPRQEEL